MDRIKQIAKNNNYKSKVIEKILARLGRNDKTQIEENKYIGSELIWDGISVGIIGMRGNSTSYSLNFPFKIVTIASIR